MSQVENIQTGTHDFTASLFVCYDAFFFFAWICCATVCQCFAYVMLQQLWNSFSFEIACQPLDGWFSLCVSENTNIPSYCVNALWCYCFKYSMWRRHLPTLMCCFSSARFWKWNLAKLNLLYAMTQLHLLLHILFPSFWQSHRFFCIRFIFQYKCKCINSLTTENKEIYCVMNDAFR